MASSNGSSDVAVGDVVVWHARSSQRLPAVVTAVNEDGSLRLRVRSDIAEEIWTGTDATDTRLLVTDRHGDVVARIGDTWEHLHQAVPRGDPTVDPRTQLSAAQNHEAESWLPIGEVKMNPLDDNDVRLKRALDALC